MSDTTEQTDMDSMVDRYMAASEAPETTEDESEVDDTEEELTEDADTGATEEEPEPEAETDEDEAGESEEDPDEDEAEAAKADQPNLIPVLVDGKEQKVTLDELKRGYSGQAKIQQDLQSNAGVRKQLEQAAQALMDQQESFLKLHQRQQQGGFKPTPTPPDPAMIEQDAVKYLRLQAKYQTDVKEYQAEQQHIEQMDRQRSAYAQAKHSETINSQVAKLRERIPELADEKTAPDFARKLFAAGSEYGYSSDELSGIEDARALEVLSDAAKWRALKAKQVTSKAPPKPTRNVKAKAARVAPVDAKAKAAKAQFRKTGSLNDAVEAFLFASNP